MIPLLPKGARSKGLLRKPDRHPTGLPENPLVCEAGGEQIAPGFQYDNPVAGGRAQPRSRVDCRFVIPIVTDDEVSRIVRRQKISLSLYV